jgi:murein DD-endopeptidase MepM/ murein hydrolase activator NlpD
MFRQLVIVSICGFVFLARMSAQEVIIVREEKPKIPKAIAVVPEQTKIEFHVEKAIPVKPVSPQIPVKKSAATRPAVVQVQRQQSIVRQPAKPEARTAQTIPARLISTRSRKPETGVASSSPRTQIRKLNTLPVQTVKLQGATAFTKLANGFDFPIGKPDAQGYYKARGFRSHGHLGEDWDGTRGGDTDLGDPIYCIGEGVVVFARDCHMGWGNVVIVRHAYREGGTVKNIDSFYGHLQRMLVRRGEFVARGQQIATMGNAHGLYDAHLHLEIRKNLEIGMSRAAFSRDFGNYYDPSQFILSHRHLQSSGAS